MHKEPRVPVERVRGSVDTLTAKQTLLRHTIDVSRCAWPRARANVRIIYALSSSTMVVGATALV